MRREFKIRRLPGGKVVAGAMNRPTKHDQDALGNVEWWDQWHAKWREMPYDSGRHGGRFPKWRHTMDYVERQK